jgi:hypothetical protein
MTSADLIPDEATARAIDDFRDAEAKLVVAEANLVRHLCEKIVIRDGRCFWVVCSRVKSGTPVVIDPVTGVVMPPQ